MTMTTLPADLLQVLPPSLPQTLQQLPPKAAHLCLEVERFVRGELAVDLTGRHLLLACSGGLDSTALLFLFYYLQQKMGLTLTVAHFNHQTRDECGADEAYVRHCCERLEIPFALGTQDVPQYAKEHGMGIEEAARTVRYAFLQEVREERGADWICTAHQADDLAEDIVMRLIRGAGWPALGGMAGVDTNRALIRPLLVTKRNKLDIFLQNLSIPWRHDASNDDMTFMRNRVRRTIMPLFLKENPAFLDNASTLWQLARLDADHWDTETEKILSAQNDMENEKADFSIIEQDGEGAIFLSRKQLSGLSEAMRLRTYKSALDRMGQGQALAGSIIKLDAAWRSNRGGAVVQFPGEKTGMIYKGGIVFKCRK